jgi:hypothetical protein
VLYLRRYKSLWIVLVAVMNSVRHEDEFLGIRKVTFKKIRLCVIMNELWGGGGRIK